MAKRKKNIRRIDPEFNETIPVGSASRVSAKKMHKGKGTVNTKKKPVSNKKKDRKHIKFNLLWRLTGKAIYWSLVAGVWTGLACVGVVIWHMMQLPRANLWAIPDRPPNARIMATHGELIANRGMTGGAAISLSDMSPYIPMAVIAIEDRRFKHHYGLDPLGLIRAMIRNIMAGHFVQGGSTLTQQLAKNLFLKPERTLGRKIQEAILAVWLESRFSKDEILEFYLNRVYFGSGTYGVDAASRRYFDKPASEATLAEAAILAGLLKAPSRLSPARNPKLAGARSRLVLAAMEREGFINANQRATAIAMRAKKAKRYWSGSEHYIADMAIKQTLKLIGEIRQDLIISTTIDINLQKKANNTIQKALAGPGKKRGVEQAALVSLDGSGAILALIGGKEYAESQFNRAVNAKRQPGSAFKPFVFLVALEDGKTPLSIRNDAPVRIGNWTPENHDRKYRGPVTLNDALSRSLNTIAAQLTMESGPGKVIKLAHRLGINSTLSNNASIALGTSETSLLEITGAYVPFANGGYRTDPFLVKRITTSDGKILFDRKPVRKKKVIAARELAMINAMLRNALELGTGKRARLKKWPAAGKTGTSQKFRDGWFIGYAEGLTTGVWFGNDNGLPTAKMTGGGLPAATWGEYMQFACNYQSFNGTSKISTTPKASPLVAMDHLSVGAIHPLKRPEQDNKKSRLTLKSLFGG